METRVIRQLFRDSASLQDYLAGREPSVGTVKRRALVLERAIDYEVPDHVYRNWRDGLIGDAQDIWSVLRGALDLYADQYVRFSGDRISIDFDRFGDWQNELARVSPLPIIAYALFRKFGAPPATVAGIERYAARHLRPLEHTVLITPICQPVEDLIARKGLYETHLHLNGSTEVDKIWQDALANMDRFIADLGQALQGSDPGPNRPDDLVLELYEQLGMRDGAAELPHQLSVARRLRLALATEVFDRAGVRPPPLRTLLTGFTMLPFEEGSQTDRHPVEAHVGEGIVHGGLAQEILLLILVYGRLKRHSDDRLARALHVYLLILNATFLPLCVQQAEQFGFEQFQKFTVNGVRWLSEESYAKRFHQLAHSPAGDLAFVEGRFAPSREPGDLRQLIRKILAGHRSFLRRSGLIPPPSRATAALADEPPDPVDLSSEEEPPRPPRMDLRLIAHFIKQNELARPNLEAGCRFSLLRADINKRWTTLRNALESFPLVRHYVTGIDAAANELHTPPEVFAPVYRAARRSGLVHLTYHVGEDFEHLITGIRAVYEAVTFLDLRDGNRVGHGTAVGIDPKLWLERCPPVLRLRRGDRLDDLVFAYQRLLEEPKATGILGRLQDEIQRLARLVYDRELDCHLLWTAWKLRRLDPLCLPQADLPLWWSPVDDEMEEYWELRRERETVRAAFDLFGRYHGPEVVAKSRELEPANRDILDADLLRCLQESVLREIRERNVVIETLPTSNVRISFYRTFKEHHAFRWLGLEPGGQSPSVSVGSDDPGIFACSLRGEFMHLYREMLRLTGSEREAIARLDHLNETGRIYRFG
ncbi:hypothetical protein [Azospirillum sp. Sh1]|uniref:hypothetical protein n=1 Tax=Azospirillum sp. Sh1 TaxID=2607285 RepID=UPI0011EECE92|nr:hypothetical protein [Azospirillum sp. Sh1]KAA0570263.1 hypothetical protein FZ029_31120 [Azospirillum sp. Sh1]